LDFFHFFLFFDLDSKAFFDLMCIFPFDASMKNDSKSRKKKRMRLINHTSPFGSLGIVSHFFSHLERQLGRKRRLDGGWLFDVLSESVKDAQHREQKKGTVTRGTTRFVLGEHCQKRKEKKKNFSNGAFQSKKEKVLSTFFVNPLNLFPTFSTRWNKKNAFSKDDFITLKNT
jgi:hypothetical protein